ncbi:MAG TPA: hypothetical protein DCP92_14525, partial [Nitrospiraceae bacterium]|nr:hypothetical protein [Nitrospiraceae bacterium]
MQIAAGKLIRLFLIILICYVSIVAFAIADQANYFYDDSGQLSRVLKSNNGLIYQYDQVGNLLAIINGITSSNPPILQSVVPNERWSPL